MAHIIKDKDRQRTYTFVVWRNEGGAAAGHDFENTWQDVARVCDSAHVKVAVSPLHDSDLYDEDDVERWVERHKGPDGKLPTHDSRGEKLAPPSVGSPKPAHWHVMVKCKGLKSPKQMADTWAGLHVSHFWTVDDPDVLLRYFAHMDSPTKAQYPIEGVTAFGGFDLSPLWGVTKAQTMAAVGSLMDAACGVVSELNPSGTPVYEFCVLANLAKDSGRPDLFESVYKGAPFWTAYLHSLAYMNGIKV